VRRAGILPLSRLVFVPSGTTWRVLVRSALGGLALAGIVAATATAAVQLAYADRVPAGVSVLGVDVSGRTKAEARGLLQAEASSLLRQPVVLRVDGREWRSTARDLGASFDVDALLDQAYTVGREGNPVERLAMQWAALLRGERLAESGLAVDAEQEEAVLRRIADEVNRPARDARVQLTRAGDGVSVDIVPEQAGLALLVPESLGRVSQAMESDLPTTVDLVADVTPPSATKADFRQAKAEAERMLAAPLVFTLEDRRWTIGRAELAGLLSFTRDPNQPARVVVDGDKLAEHLKKIAGEIEQPALDARFDWNGGSLRVIRDSQEGRGLDVEAVKAQTLGRLASSDRTIPLSLAVVQPAVASGDADRLGIRELISQGRTSFAGSVSEKQHNITLAASRLNGVVVPPGATFSFNREVGPTTLAAGFKTGWGITLSSSGAQTIPSVAGGICQVATTLFHPVFHAGYTIEERHWHLYWIPSYGQPPLGMKGLDATVDEDSHLDFQFINSTPDYLLIQAVVEGSNLVFRLYGTKPTWDVKIDGPVITKFVPTDRTPVSQPEPTMPQGKRLQVEGAQDGFDATIVRTVTQGDDTRTLTLKSHYIPSHNVVLYGTGPG